MRVTPNSKKLYSAQGACPRVTRRLCLPRHPDEGEQSGDDVFFCT